MEKSKKKWRKKKKQTGQVFLPPPFFFFFFERGLAACVVFPFWDLLFVCLFVFFRFQWCHYFNVPADNRI